MSLVCTHLGCTVNQTKADLRVHATVQKYDAQGNVLTGPAKKQLNALRVEVVWKLQLKSCSWAVKMCDREKSTRRCVVWRILAALRSVRDGYVRVCERVRIVLASLASEIAVGISGMTLPALNLDEILLPVISCRKARGVGEAESHL